MAREGNNSQKTSKTMNIENGQILTGDEISKLEPEQKKLFRPVVRDLSKLEELDKQIRLYSPCGCGSGKKFKFCCYKPAL